MSISTDDKPEPARPALTSLLDHGRDAVRRGGRVLGIVMLALVGFWLLRGFAQPGGYLSFDAGVLFAIALVAAGVLLLRGQEPVLEGAETERVQRPRSPLGILTLSAVFLLVGLLILLSNLDVGGIGIGQIAAAALLVVGLGLLAGAWWGRSRFLILVGVLMIPAVVVGGFIDFPLRGSVGSRYINRQSIEQVADSYELLAGNMTLDLLEVTDFPATRTIDFEVAAGRVTIFIPERVGLTVTGDIEWGNATLGRGREQGEDLHFTNELEGKPGKGHLRINFNGGIASLYIERISHRERYGSPPEEEEGKEGVEEKRRRQRSGNEKDRRRERAKT